MEQAEFIYHFKKSRKQRAPLFFRGTFIFLLYIAGMLAYEHYTGERLPEDLRLACLWGFSIAGLGSSLVGWWHLKNPGVFEIKLTREQLTVHYPGCEAWSFACDPGEIVRFEHRRRHNHAGKSPLESGILLKDGSFHHISMNYGNNLKHLFKAVQSIYPDVTFPKTVNTKYQGLGLDRDYKP